MVDVTLEDPYGGSHYDVVSIASPVGLLLPSKLGDPSMFAWMGGLFGMAMFLPLRAGALHAIPPHRWTATLPWSLQTGQFGLSSQLVAV